MSSFQQLKLFIVEYVHLAKDALHIYVALAVFLGACLLFGWKARQLKPWLLVMFVALAGEIWDIRDATAGGGPIILDDSWKDLWNTMLVPTILLLAARFTSVFAAPEELGAEESGDEAEVVAGAARREGDVL